ENCNLFGAGLCFFRCFFWFGFFWHHSGDRHIFRSGFFLSRENSFSNDKKRALRVASKIEAGCVDINKGNHWLACNPFGGYKASGMGREHGRHGFQELCQIKVIAQG
ncbi:MAG: aldehyde dehydrogenase family protein, partial [Patescibacteria group bacterium]